MWKSCLALKQTRPSHSVWDINFSALFFPPLPSFFLSLPLCISPSALPQHLASSLSLTPFPLFYVFFSFQVLPLSLQISQFYPPSLSLFSFSKWTIFLFLFGVVFPSVSLLLLSPSCLGWFCNSQFRLYHQICFFMCILCCLVLFKTNCSFKTSFSIHSIHLHSVALFSNLDLAWVGHVWAQSVRSFLKIPGTVAIWRSIERKALNIQTDTTHSLTDAQCDGIKCVLCGQWACPPLISFPWRIDIILWTA